MSLQRITPTPNSRLGMSGGGVMIPQGVGAPPPPGMDSRRGKLMCIKVRMLDDTVGVFHLGHKALGQALFDEVCRHLNLLECDYFGLQFVDCYGNNCWLDKDKPILRQISSTQSDARFYFIVKFYTPNPTELEEEYSRYLMALQIKRDLASGELICHENTAALLASYIVQSECGDFSPEDYPDATYLSSARFLPNQSIEFQKRVMENHMKLVGMSPGNSDLALLETARRCDFYGVKLHAAKDVEGTDVSLTVAHMGIRVFHQLQCVSTFSWAKIRKLSFKRRKLLIKLHPESYQYYKETIEFAFESRNECKNFWKKCVEHHAFFRCSEIETPRKSKEARLFSKGSSFRYHGRTQKQLIDYVREHRKRREPFTRPIKSGFPSQSEKVSRQATFGVSPGYSTVSERSINVVRARTTPHDRRHLNERPATSMPNIDHRRHPDAGNTQPTSSRSYTADYSQHPQNSSSYSLRTTRHRQDPSTRNDGVVSDSERMCISDFENPCSSGYMESSRCMPPKPTTISKMTPGKSTDTEDDTDNAGDPMMSVSLPNVLGDDMQTVRKELELKRECPPKSASGDNFLDMNQRSGGDFDNISEDSYRLSDNEQRSQRTDPTNAVYATTFTAKRVGNVIVKRVVTGSRSTPNTDDEDSTRESRPKNTYESLPASHSYAIQAPPRPSHGDIRPSGCSSAPSSSIEYPIHQRLVSVAVEIDGPNIDLNRYRSAGGRETMMQHRPTILRAADPPKTHVSDLNTFRTTRSGPIRIPAKESRENVVYTSSGAVLHKPKIIPDVDTYRVDEAIYSQVKASHPAEYAQKSATFASTPPKTHGAIGPLPGKVITKENLVITPEGMREKKIKPVVPPKPKHLSSSPKEETTASQLLSGTKTSSHPVVNLQQNESTVVEANANKEQLQRPTLISVESEDRPDIKKCHLFNGDIPYVLTLRNRDYPAEDSGFSTFKGSSERKLAPGNIAGTSTESYNAHQSRRSSSSSSRSPESFKRRKSLDLVHRKHLPSPRTFSSQDHSISPTTPESGDVIEYVLKRRSMSHERSSSLAKKGRRSDPRRQTQPVRFNLPPSPDGEPSNVTSHSQPTLVDENESDHACETQSLPGEGDAVRDCPHSQLIRSLSNAESSTSTDAPANILCTIEVDKALESATIRSSVQEIAMDQRRAAVGATISGDLLTSRSSPQDTPGASQEPPQDEPLPPPPSSLRPSLDHPDQLTFVDESSTSSNSKDETEKAQREDYPSSATSRTPTGVLWTDF